MAIVALNVSKVVVVQQFWKGNEVVEAMWKNAAEMQSRIAKRGYHGDEQQTYSRVHCGSYAV